jgi:hypothetical protein
MHGRNRFRRLVPVLAAATLVAGLAVPAHARPAVRPSARAAASSPLAGLWSSVSRLLSGGLSGAGSLRGIFGAEGASLDPHGSPAAGPAGGAAAVHGQGGA